MVEKDFLRLIDDKALIRHLDPLFSTPSPSCYTRLPRLFLHLVPSLPDSSPSSSPLCSHLAPPPNDFDRADVAVHDAFPQPPLNLFLVLFIIFFVNVVVLKV